jgi:hypothetical protein
MKLIDRIKLAWNFIFNYKSNETNFDKIYKHNRVYMCYRCNKKQVSQWGSLCDRCFDVAHGY